MRPDAAEKVKCRKELYTMRKKASITVYLSLIFSVILTLIAGSLQSVRMAYARVMTAGAAEQGIYSAFSRFDRKLLEEYELFFLDGGCGTGEWQPGTYYQTAEDTAAWILGNGEGNGVLDGFSSPLRLESGSIAAYQLATDNHGEAFFSQVCRAMKENLGAYGIQQLSKKLKKQESVWDTQEKQNGVGNTDTTIEDYEEAIKAAEENQEENQNGSEGETEDGSTGEISGDFVNPIEVIKQIRKMGILSLVLPSGNTLPGAEAEISTFVSRRSVQEGFQVINKEREVEFVDKLLQNEYLLWKFPHYTDQQETQGLQCQIEYAIGGKSSDLENLKAVAGQLLVAREAANAVHILTNARKRAEVNAMSLTIASAIGLPVASGIIGTALTACWAFAESILDVRELLDGGKIALVKTDASWQLSLENLPRLLEGLDSLRKSSSDGLSYEDYLRLLLLKENSDKINERTMDLVEHNMRTRLETPEFYMDQCIASMSIQFQVKSGKQILEIERGYNYGTEV